MGRIFPTHREDVMEAAAVAGGMLRGEVEPTYTPRNPLDVLAQQIVAMVSVEDWEVDDALSLWCAALTPTETWRFARLHAVLEMLSGRYPSLSARRAAPAHRLGPGQPPPGGAARLAPARRDQRRHDPRPWRVRRLPA